MSIVQKYRDTQAAIQELQNQLQAMEGNDALKKEMEFEEKLRSLMGEYGKSLRDIIALLDPESTQGKSKATKQYAGVTRRERKVKQYKNPHTGEVVETKGGNHKTLKEWKAKWGGDVVEGWAKLIG